MNRWATLVVFTFGFLIAFGGTISIGSVGPSPLALWGLILCAGTMLCSLPKLTSIDGKTVLLLTYSLPLTLFWVLSNPRFPGSSGKILFLKAVILGLAIASLIALGFFLSIYKKQASFRPVALAAIPLLLCCYLVASFSAGGGGSNHMVIALMQRFRWDQATAETFVFWFRKSVHFVFYGTLGLLAFRLARKGGLVQRAPAFALVFLALHASFDELRQSGFANRTGSFWDVCLDFAGGLAFVGAAATLARVRSTRRGTRNGLDMQAKNR